MRIKTRSALVALMIVFVTLWTLPATALANAGEAAENAEQATETTGQATLPVEAEPKPAPEVEPVPLTPEGQMTLVDDISGDEAEGKQFLTIITKNGNYFYLVIDRTGDTENVHFLNLVDESDLLALIEGEPTATTPVTTPAPVEQEPLTAEPTASEPEPTVQPLAQLNLPVILGAIVLLALAGAGVLLYIKVLKPKRGAKAGNPNDIDFANFDFDDDEQEGLPFAADDDTDVDEPTEDTGYVAADDKQEARADR
jgi:hypothetical protein